MTFNNQSGASCSNFTTLLFNDSLKFQMAILQIHCNFLLKNAKDSHIFSRKNNSAFAFEVDYSQQIEGLTTPLS